MRYKDKCVYINEEYVPIGYSVGSVLSMVKLSFIDSVTHFHEIDPYSLNRLELYFMITAGLWHYDSALKVNEVSHLLENVPIKKMQRAVKAALDILKEPPRKTELQ